MIDSLPIFVGACRATKLRVGYCHGPGQEASVSLSKLGPCAGGPFWLNVRLPTCGWNHGPLVTMPGWNYQRPHPIGMRRYMDISLCHLPNTNSFPLTHSIQNMYYLLKASSKFTFKNYWKYRLNVFIGLYKWIRMKFQFWGSIHLFIANIVKYSIVKFCFASCIPGWGYRNTMDHGDVTFSTYNFIHKTEKNSILFHFLEWNFIHENVSCLVHHFLEWNFIHENEIIHYCIARNVCRINK